MDAVLDGAVRRYLTMADRLLPGRLEGLYVVGSAALGAFRPGRSDIDFVAVLSGPATSADVRRLRVLHATTAAGTAPRAVLRGQPLTGACNGVFVRVDDLRPPVTAIRPLASHSGHQFWVGRGFDVNPVVWKNLAERGIAVRGPAPSELGLDCEPGRLRAWNLDNLDRYWSPWASTLLTAPTRTARFRPRWTTAWGVLGAPRLHHTIATREVISKEAAGNYALEVFDRSWHPIIREGLAYWLGQPADPAFRAVRKRAQRTAEFVLEVVAAAHAL